MSSTSLVNFLVQFRNLWSECGTTARTTDLDKKVEQLIKEFGLKNNATLEQWINPTRVQSHEEHFKNLHDIADLHKRLRNDQRQKEPPKPFLSTLEIIKIQELYILLHTFYMDYVEPERENTNELAAQLRRCLDREYNSNPHQEQTHKHEQTEQEIASSSIHTKINTIEQLVRGVDKKISALPTKLITELHNDDNTLSEWLKEIGNVKEIGDEVSISSGEFQDPADANEYRVVP